MSLSCETMASTIERTRGLSEPPTPPWISPSGEGGDHRGGGALAALAGMPFAARFSSWTGLSGRRYVFSVYPASTCPAFCHAVLLAAARDGAGRRSVVSVRLTGAFPEPVVARAQREFRGFGPGLEFHLHLLPSSPASRTATIADLAIAPR
jgi:hypothetical protein